MDEPKEEDHREQVRGLQTQMLLETIEVLETLVDDREGNDRIDEVRVGADPQQCRTQKGDAVTQGKGGDEADDVAKAAEKEEDAEEKSQPWNKFWIALPVVRLVERWLVNLQGVC